jgi:3-oxoadipate enol-lactonase
MQPPIPAGRTGEGCLMPDRVRSLSSREARVAASLSYDANIRIEGEGPPLVYVPGMDGTGLLFYRQVPSLARRFSVVTYRLRDEAPTMQALIDDLNAIVTSVGDNHERVVLVGESFGGALSMSFVHAHQAQVSGMVVLNSFPYFAPQLRLRLAALGVRTMPWGAMGLVRRVSALRLHSPLTHRDEIRRFFALTALTTREGYLNRLRILMRYDARPLLPQVTVPTLFLAADRDNLIPSVREATRMRALMPDAELHVLRGHGHSCFLSHHLDLDLLLRDWGERCLHPQAPEVAPTAKHV